METLFGSEETVEVGAPTIVPHLASQRANLLEMAKPILSDPEQFFRPQDISTEELLAQQAILSPFQDPAAYQQQIETFLSPYRDIVTQDINRAFESPAGQLAAQATEAGAFGSTRHRGAQGDLERARLDAIANAMQQQYNVAQGQLQQGIGNLLGFGGFQRELDLAQRQAPITGAQAYRDITVTPFIGAPTYTPTTVTGGSGGLLGGLSSVAGILGAPNPFFSGAETVNWF